MFYPGNLKLNTMSTEEIREQGIKHFENNMGFLWDGYTDAVKESVLFAYVQGFLAGELFKINERIQELQGA